MDTLTNVHLTQSETSLQGLTVRYAPNPEKQWFVLRATYDRQDRAYDYIVSCHTDAFLPLHYVTKLVDGQPKSVVEPLLHNLLFVYASPRQMEDYVQHTPQLAYVNYFYDRSKRVEGANPPLTIPYEDMMNFIHVLSVPNEHVMVVDKERCRFKSDDDVLVTQGEFEGVWGKVVRVAGQQRVVVSLGGLCLVATAYIPSAFLKTLP